MRVRVVVRAARHCVPRHSTRSPFASQAAPLPARSPHSVHVIGRVVRRDAVPPFVLAAVTRATGPPLPQPATIASVMPATCHLRTRSRTVSFAVTALPILGRNRGDASAISFLVVRVFANPTHIRPPTRVFFIRRLASTRPFLAGFFFFPFFFFFF